MRDRFRRQVMAGDGSELCDWRGIDMVAENDLEDHRALQAVKKRASGAMLTHSDLLAAGLHSLVLLSHSRNPTMRFLYNAV